MCGRRVFITIQRSCLCQFDDFIGLHARPDAESLRAKPDKEHGRAEVICLSNIVKVEG